MGLDKKKLLLITAQYPYGKGEDFLQTEMVYLSAHFDEIYIMPRLICEKAKSKDMPSNVKVSTILGESCEKPIGLRWITLFFQASWLYITLLFLEKNSLYLIQRPFLFSRIKKEIQDAKKISDYLHENCLNGITTYCYWAFGNILSTCLLKKKKLIGKTVCRCHGFDLYDERWKIGFVPFRRLLSKYFDTILTVSEFGENYFKKRISLSFHNKVSTSYLGTRNCYEIFNQNKNNGSIVLVSCSSLIPLKRVELIPPLLKQIDLPLTWIHFGDGDTREEIKIEIEQLPIHLKCELRGETENKEVLNFFKNSHISCFLSLSSTEGLPYSMIEAASFGIPIVACDVGGVSEIVNRKTGILLDPTPNKEIWSEQLKKVLTGEFSFDPMEIAQFQREKFSSEKNFKQLIEDHLS